MSAALRFGSFELHPTHRRLLVDGKAVAVGARAFDVLLALAARPGELVTKRQLLDLAWPGLIVEENNLHVQIGTLRKLIGAHAIATIPGRGYRLTLDRKEERSTSASAVAAVHESVRPSAVDATALYGRDDDIAKLDALLFDHALVTVVGPAGIGKTRLVLEFVRRRAGSFLDGARVVELAPLEDPTLVASTVARALDVWVGDGPANVDSALRTIGTRQVLLVIDNCEHLREAVGVVVSALRRNAPGVRVLATSQEVLRHPQEQVYRVGPLQVPQESTFDAASQASAIQLFRARVRAADPGFDLDARNIEGVVEICRRLDGIPLALELAAARVPLLGVEGVRLRLDERFRLLTGGSRSELRRHQTLRAALEWSHGLLEANEQRVFAALGVFSGSFSMDSAQALLSGSEMDAWAVLESLALLVDKSLVTVQARDSALPRYRLLETTRAFALERLATSSDTAVMLRRHAEVTLDIFERGYRDFMNGSQAAVERLMYDHGNLRGALNWACKDAGDMRIAVSLFGAAFGIGDWKVLMTLRMESRQWHATLRSRVDNSIPTELAARFWLACAEWGSWVLPPQAVEDARRAIDIYTELGDRLATFRGWLSLSYALLQAGRREEAADAVQQALAIRDPQWPEFILALCDGYAGLAFKEANKPSLARPHMLSVLARSRSRGNVSDELNARAQLIDLDAAQGHIEQAADGAAELLSHPDSLRLPWNDGRALRTLGTALLMASRLDDAERAYRAAIPVLRRYFGNAASMLLDAATWLARHERLEDAARVCAYAQGVNEREGRAPRLVAQRLHEALCAELDARLGKAAIERLSVEGRALDDEAACSLAFPPAPPIARR